MDIQISKYISEEGSITRFFFFYQSAFHAASRHSKPLNMAVWEELDVWWQRNDAAHTAIHVMHSPLSQYEIVSRVPRFPRHGASTRPAEFCSSVLAVPVEVSSYLRRGRKRERKKKGTIESSVNLIGRRRVAAWPTQFVQPGQTFASNDEAFAFRQWWTYTLVARQRIFLPVLRLIPIIGSNIPSDDGLSWTGFILEKEGSW